MQVPFEGVSLCGPALLSGEKGLVEAAGVELAQAVENTEVVDPRQG
jgi:hypothetical protein